MRRPSSVSVMAVQDRRARGVRRPWVVRWRVDGQEHSRSFGTKAAAEDLRARLLIAAPRPTPPSRYGRPRTHGLGTGHEMQSSRAHCATGPLTHRPFSRQARVRSTSSDGGDE